MTIASQRYLFDVPEDIAYFNCAYSAPLLNESQKRMVSGMSLKRHPWKRMPPDFFEDAETIRRLASDLFGGDADGYAIGPAASYGLSTAARAIEPQLQKGDVILLIDEEFPSNVLPWRRIAQERGVTIRNVPTPGSGNWADAIIDQLDESVKVAALSTCHWTNGSFIDLVAIRKACDKTGTTLVIDATQSLGAMPFPMNEVRPDFLVAAGYKWMLCPYGFSLLYVAERWRNSRPLEENWQARKNAQDFASLVNYSDEYMPGSRRFDVGEKCTETILPGVIAALEQVKVWGIQNIADSIEVINKRLAAHLTYLGFKLPDNAQRCPHMFGAVIPDTYKGNLVSELRERKIFVSQRGKSIRFSPHLYIDEQDIQRFLQALDELIKSR